MTRGAWVWITGLAWLGGALLVSAQIDPQRRELIQMGYNQPLEGRGPLAAYGFYYRNQPQFLKHTNLTLRLAVAPVYLDSELGIGQAISPQTDLGIGLSGGGFADSYSEVRRGKYEREESFLGHGGEISSSVYHLFNPASRIRWAATSSCPGQRSALPCLISLSPRLTNRVTPRLTRLDGDGAHLIRVPRDDHSS
jgi:hypothetical protein